MCNLYSNRRTAAEIADLFRAINNAAGSNHGELVYPQYPGLVVAGGEVRSMTWGFPLAQRSKKTGQPLKPRPVNNARTDKLDSFMWRFSFAERRCLIPADAWAEAEGERGAMTRTWLSLPDRETFAIAGIWRDSDEWGPVYSMVMTDASEAFGAVHDRMPVLLTADDHAVWTDGSPEAAFSLCKPWRGAVTIKRTEESWSRSK